MIAHLATLPVLVAAICVNKRALAPGHALDGDRRLYFYCLRFLLERISWIARDERIAGEGDGRCKLTFSHSKGLPYSRLAGYLAHLQTSETQVDWAHVDASKFNVAGHSTSIWLRAVDSLASGMAKAFEASDFAYCKDRSVRLLKPVIYQRGGGARRYTSYGLKMFPCVPALPAQATGRYGWISEFQ